MEGLKGLDACDPEGRDGLAKLSQKEAAASALM